MLITSAVPCLLVLPLRITVPESPLWLTNRGSYDRAAAIVRDKLGMDVSAARKHARRTLGAGPLAAALPARMAPAHICRMCIFYLPGHPVFRGGNLRLPSDDGHESQERLCRRPILQSLAAGWGHRGPDGRGPHFAQKFSDRQLRHRRGKHAGLCTVERHSRGRHDAFYSHYSPVFYRLRPISVYVYLPELFPTDLRASGMGIAIAASRIGSAVSTFLLPVVVAGYGVRTALGACVAVLAIGAVICQRWAPETKHVRLGAFEPLPGR